MAAKESLMTEDSMLGRANLGMFLYKAKVLVAPGQRMSRRPMIRWENGSAIARSHLLNSGVSDCICEMSASIFQADFPDAD